MRVKFQLNRADMTWSTLPDRMAFLTVILIVVPDLESLCQILFITDLVMTMPLLFLLGGHAPHQIKRCLINTFLSNESDPLFRAGLIRSNYELII